MADPLTDLTSRGVSISVKDPAYPDTRYVTDLEAGEENRA